MLLFSAIGSAQTFVILFLALLTVQIYQLAIRLYLYTNSLYRNNHYF